MWQMALALAGGAVMGALDSKGQKNRSSSSRTYKPGVLRQKDYINLATDYRNKTADYLNSEPGWTGQHYSQAKQQAHRAINARGDVNRREMRSYQQRRGIRGPMTQDMENIMQQGEYEAMARANLEIDLARHAILESDTNRRLAAAAGFLWPAEAANAAGQLESGTSKGTSGESNMWAGAMRGAITSGFGYMNA